MTSKWNFSKDMKPIEDDILEVGFFKGAQERKIKVHVDLLRSVMSLEKDVSVKRVDSIAYNFFATQAVFLNPKAIISNHELIMEAVSSFFSEHKDLKDEQCPILSFCNIDHYLGEEAGFAKTTINNNFNKYNIEIQ